MSQRQDFRLGRFTDSLLQIALVPPTPIGGVSLQLVMWHRFQNVSGNVSGIITKSMASGFYNYVSGMDIVNSGEGIFNVQFYGTDISGDINPGNYYYRVTRLTSGLGTTAVDGYRLMV